MKAKVIYVRCINHDYMTVDKYTPSVGTIGKVLRAVDFGYLVQWPQGSVESKSDAWGATDRWHIPKHATEIIKASQISPLERQRLAIRAAINANEYLEEGE